MGCYMLMCCSTDKLVGYNYFVHLYPIALAPQLPFPIKCFAYLHVLFVCVCFRVLLSSQFPHLFGHYSLTHSQKSVQQMDFDKNGNAHSLQKLQQIILLFCCFNIVLFFSAAGMMDGWLVGWLNVCIEWINRQIGEWIVGWMDVDR